MAGTTSLVVAVDLPRVAVLEAEEVVREGFVSSPPRRRGQRVAAWLVDHHRGHGRLVVPGVCRHHPARRRCLNRWTTMPVSSTFTNSFGMPTQ